MEFTFVDRGDNNFAFEHKQGNKVIAEISWVQKGDVMSMDHTFVSDTLRGQGVAKQLLDRAAEYARAEGYKMEAVCSYVVAAFKRNTYDDVKA